VTESLLVISRLGHPTPAGTDLLLRKSLRNPDRGQMSCLDLLSPRDALQSIEGRLVESDRQNPWQWPSYTDTHRATCLEEASEVFIAKSVPLDSLLAKSAPV
jgi:hypothetical protein